MLGPAQANTFRAKIPRCLRIQRRFGICAHFHAAAGIGPHHQCAEITHQFRLQGRNLARHHFAGRAVERQYVAFGQGAASDAQDACCCINLQATRAGNAGTPQAARNNRRMAGHPAACRQYALCGMHAVNIFGAGFDADQYDRLAHIVEAFRRVGVEHNLARCRARGRGQARRQHIARCVGIQCRVQQLVERRRLAPQHCRVRANQTGFRHMHCDFERGLCGALARPGLQHPQFLALNSELDILHIAIMGFEDFKDPRQFGIDRRHRLFHGQRLGPGTFACGLGQILRRADAGNDILTLRIDQIFAIIGILARGGIAGEGNTCGRCFAHIAEDHGLHIDRSAPVAGDVIEAAIDLGTVRFPRTKDGADGTPKLVMHILRKGLSPFGLDQFLICGNQCLQIIGG